MPFTPTHVVAVVPVAALCGRALPFSALAIGCMVPDFPLFVPFVTDYGMTHSIAGLFHGVLAVGNGVLFLFPGPHQSSAGSAVAGAAASSDCVHLAAMPFDESDLSDGNCSSCGPRVVYAHRLGFILAQGSMGHTGAPCAGCACSHHPWSPGAGIQSPATWQHAGGSSSTVRLRLVVDSPPTIGGSHRAASANSSEARCFCSFRCDSACHRSLGLLAQRERFRRQGLSDHHNFGVDCNERRLGILRRVSPCDKRTASLNRVTTSPMTAAPRQRSS